MFFFSQQGNEDWVDEVRGLGLRDNVELDGRKAHDICDILHALHDQKVAAEEKKKRPLNKEEINRLLKSQQAGSNMKDGLFKQIWAFARTEGKFWDCFSKIPPTVFFTIIYYKFKIVKIDWRAKRAADGLEKHVEIDWRAKRAADCARKTSENVDCFPNVPQKNCCPK